MSLYEGKMKLISRLFDLEMNRRAPPNVLVMNFRVTATLLIEQSTVISVFGWYIRTRLVTDSRLRASSGLLIAFFSRLDPEAVGGEAFVGEATFLLHSAACCSE